ncbi:Flp pilus assembly protein CpaB [Paracraurococcus ruber]|uniref:Flp pilus assembly protein CpaB n=1 Tax=Paracraurococcus ruber TaxID=77675 RepID=A0ABS1D2Q3_9PROT|nr:Flp pilus assembly protein CpaB [Paracraurococcus ruber]MBK1660771.1 Flp pilus assembly protein CpaB [Paracraurococcus ruber]TDG30501.1 Flp pilus assembly protein CpaB [Paracraurococcus ruber]
MLLRILLIGLLLVGFVGFGGYAWLSLQPAAPPVAEAPPAKSVVLVAARPLRAGTLVKPEDLEVRELPPEAVPAAALRDTREGRSGLLGAMVRRSLPPGEFLLAEDLLKPGDRGFLAAVLGPDMRAVSVGVDAVSGAAGLIWPGDRVDVVLTQQLTDDSLPLYRRVAGETVLADARVIAIDQALVQGAVGEGPEISRQARTVTLEVTQRGAERVAVATRLGRLSLVIRSATGAEAGPAPEPAITWGGDVSPALRNGRPTPEGNPHTLQIFQGTAKREEFRF